MNDVIVIGSMNMDLVVRTGRVPSGGETLHGNDFHMIPGGKGANQAVAIARLGGRVAMIGRVGQDSFGEILCKGLAQDGVDAARIKTDASAPSGVALIMVEDNGENRIIVVAGANHNVSPQDVLEAEALLKQARMCVVQFEVPMNVVETVFRAAQRWNVPVLVNAAPAYPISAELFPLIEYLVVNENEAGVLAGIEVTGLDSARQAARILVQRGARHVILTLGALGALGCSLVEESAIPAFPIEAVDTTAAGDAFIGGLVISLLDHAGSLAEHIRFANAAGAVAATRLGAQSSLPERAEVEALLR
jgi:ribokinase